MSIGHERRMYGGITVAGSVLALVFLIAPLLVVGLISFSASRYLEFPPPGFSLRWYKTAFTESSWLAALLLSLQVATVVAILATVVGTLAALGFVRGHFRAKGFLFAAALTPMVVPGIVVAVGSYFLFAHLGLLETRTALILAHTGLALPIVLISVTASLRSVDPECEYVARTLGAGTLEAMWKVTIPLVRPGIISGALFAFVTSFDEPVVALFVAGTHAVTLPKRMWDGIQFEIDPTAAAVSTVLICVAVTAVVLAGRYGRFRT